VRQIKQDLKNNEFKRFYLLTGDEEYLKSLYKKRLVAAMISDGSDMNLNYFEGKGIDAAEVKGISETLPFFADKRLIVITMSGWFKSASEFADYIASSPETTYFIFAESEVDKRNKLYKFVAANGYIAEFGQQSPSDLMMTVALILKQKGLAISKSNCEYFLSRVGTDVARIYSELDKLSGYCADQAEVKREDIEAICVEIPESKIFAMMDAMMAGNSERTFELYYDLLACYEKPMSILFRLITNYNQFYQTMLLNSKGESKQGIVSTAGIRDFVVDKYLRMRSKYTVSKLSEIVENGLELEAKIKRGDMDERIAVEIFLNKYCK
jgi:DNA polymerase-3 subunit delta